VPRHTRDILNKHEAKNEPTPVAIFIGHHPLLHGRGHDGRVRNG
jgi:3-polyprenyl-4-hydroxybenzoate decarboxylase